MMPICKGVQGHGSKRKKKANKVINVQETYALIRVKTIGHTWEDRQKQIAEVEGVKQSNTGVKQGTKA